jgi:glutamate/tyrosine decarboxylase-like PLP-dependent enzyme
MKNIMKHLVDEIEDVYSNIEKYKLIPSVTPEEIRKELQKYDFQNPVSLDSLISDISLMLKKWSVNTTHPGYFGLFNPAVQLSAIAADSLTAVFNPQLATWTHAPAGNEIEQTVLKFISSKFGYLPESGLVNFTTGGAEANLTAVIVALTHKFPGYGNEGVLSIKSQPVFYVSEEAHHSFNKIAHSTGIGRNSVRVVKSDNKLKLDINDIKEKILKDKSAGLIPFMAVGTVGTTSGGIIDPLNDLADICIDNNLWFHVDAAWGGAAIFSSKLKGHLAGIERSDSITCDAHKWFAVPMGAGMFFCKHKAPVLNAFRVSTAYMPETVNDTYEPYLSTIQWSRRFIGLKVFMALAEMGEKGFAEMIEHQTSLGNELKNGLKESGWIIVNETPLPVVCFTHQKIQNGKMPMKSILTKLYEKGNVWISETVLQSNIPVLRACVANYRSQIKDVRNLLDELNAIINNNN